MRTTFLLFNFTQSIQSAQYELTPVHRQIAQFLQAQIRSVPRAQFNFWPFPIPRSPKRALIPGASVLCLLVTRGANSELLIPLLVVCPARSKLLRL